MTDAEFRKRFDEHAERFDKHTERFDRHSERIERTLTRIDGHLEVANHHMARGNRLMDEVREANEATRRFMRDLLLRNERVMEGMVSELAEGRDQLRANTQAVLAMIDRLGPARG